MRISHLNEANCGAGRPCLSFFEEDSRQQREVDLDLLDCLLLVLYLYS